MKPSMAFKMFSAFVFASLVTDAATSQSVAACEGEDQGKCIGEEVGYDESAMLQVSTRSLHQPVQPHNVATNSAQDLLQAPEIANVNVLTQGEEFQLFRGQEKQFREEPLKMMSTGTWKKGNVLWLTRVKCKAVKHYAKSLGLLFTYTPKPKTHLRLLHIHPHSVRVVEEILQPIAKKANLQSQPWQVSQAGVVTRSSNHGRDAAWAKVFCAVAQDLVLDGQKLKLDGYSADALGNFHSEVMICNPQEKLKHVHKVDLQQESQAVRDLLSTRDDSSECDGESSGSAKAVDTTQAFASAVASVTEIIPAAAVPTLDVACSNCQNSCPAMEARTVVPTARVFNTKCVNQKSLSSQGWTGGDVYACAQLAMETGWKEDCTSGFFTHSSGGDCAVVPDKCLGDDAEPAQGVVLYSMTLNMPAEGVKAPDCQDKVWNTLGTSNFKLAQPGTGAGSLDCGAGWQFVMTQEKCREAGDALGVAPMEKKELSILNALFLTASQQIFDHTLFTFDPANFNATTIMNLAPQAHEFTFDVPLWDPGCLVSPGGYKGVWSAFVAPNTLWFNLDTSGIGQQSPFVFTKVRVCMKS